MIHLLQHILKFAGGLTKECSCMNTWWLEGTCEIYLSARCNAIVHVLLVCRLCLNEATAFDVDGEDLCETHSFPLARCGISSCLLVNVKWRKRDSPPELTPCTPFSEFRWAHLYLRSSYIHPHAAFRCAFEHFTFLFIAATTAHLLYVCFEGYSPPIYFTRDFPTAFLKNKKQRSMFIFCACLRLVTSRVNFTRR